jgi:hypothetical protein
VPKSELFFEQLNEFGVWELRVPCKMVVEKLITCVLCKPSTWNQAQPKHRNRFVILKEQKFVWSHSIFQHTVKDGDV